MLKTTERKRNSIFIQIFIITDTTKELFLLINIADWFITYSHIYQLVISTTRGQRVDAGGLIFVISSSIIIFWWCPQSNCIRRTLSLQTQAPKLFCSDGLIFYPSPLKIWERKRKSERGRGREEIGFNYVDPYPWYFSK